MVWESPETLVVASSCTLPDLSSVEVLCALSSIRISQTERDFIWSRGMLARRLLDRRVKLPTTDLCNAWTDRCMLDRKEAVLLRGEVGALKLAVESCLEMFNAAK